MADVIYGTVTSVTDGDTFDVSVYYQSPGNKLSYNKSETVRVANIDAPELPSAAGLTAKTKLERRILGKNVRLEVQARDKFGRLVCNVTLT